MCNTCHDFLWVLASGTLNAIGLQSSSVDIVFDSTETQQRNVSQSEPNVLIWSDWSYCLTPPELHDTQQTGKVPQRNFFGVFFGATHSSTLVLTLTEKTEVVTVFGMKNPKRMSHNSSYVSVEAVIEKRHLPSSLLNINHGLCCFTCMAYSTSMTEYNVKLYKMGWVKERLSDDYRQHHVHVPPQ